MHPSLRVLLYLISALGLPGLSFFGVLAVALLLPVAFHKRVPVMMKSLWKTRWLFLVLVLGYAYSLPGPALWPAWGDYSPSVPGLDAAVMQALRLVVLLSLLDVLVVSMGVSRMMSGLHGLFGGLAHLGMPAERLTVRLALTLQAMERNMSNPAGIGDRLRGLDGEIEPVDVLTVQTERWCARDSLVLLGALAGLVWLWFV